MNNIELATLISFATDCSVNKVDFSSDFRNMHYFRTFQNTDLNFQVMSVCETSEMFGECSRERCLALEKQKQLFSDITGKNTYE